MTDQQEAERVHRPWWRRMVLGVGLVVAAFAVAAVIMAAAWLQGPGLDSLFSSSDETAQSSGSFGLGSDIIRLAVDEPSYYWTVIENPDFSCTGFNDEFEELAEGGMSDAQNVLVVMMSVQEQLCLHQEGQADFEVDTLGAARQYNDMSVRVSAVELEAREMPLALQEDEKTYYAEGDLRAWYSFMEGDARALVQERQDPSPDQSELWHRERLLRYDIAMYNKWVAIQGAAPDGLPISVTWGDAVGGAMAELEPVGG